MIHLRIKFCYLL